MVRHDEATGLVVVERGRYRVAVNLGSSPVEADLHLNSTRGNSTRGNSTRGRVVLVAMDRTTTLSSDGTVSLLADSAVVVGPSTAG